MADSNASQTDKHNITQQGEKFQATVTRYFDDMDRAVQWAESVFNRDTPELPASAMDAAAAENIDSNVNLAPIPAGAEQVLSGGGSSNIGTPKTEVVPAQPIVDNTAAGTHDPRLDTETTQVPATDTPKQPETLSADVTAPASLPGNA